MKQTIVLLGLVIFALIGTVLAQDPGDTTDDNWCYEGERWGDGRCNHDDPFINHYNWVAGWCHAQIENGNYEGSYEQCIHLVNPNVNVVVPTPLLATLPPVPPTFTPAASVTPVPDVDLVVGLSFSPISGAGGTSTQVTISVTNNGPGPAYSVTTTDTLHNFSAIFVDPGSPTPPQGTYNYGAGNWLLPVVSAGQTVTFTFTLDVQNTAVLGSVANITATTGSPLVNDLVLGNNTMAASFTVSS